MKINGKTLNQYASRANAVAIWRRRLTTNTKKNLYRLGSLLTMTKASLQPPKKGTVKTIKLVYIGGATDDQTLQKHLRRIQKVLCIETMDNQTVRLGRLEVNVEFEGFPQMEMAS